MKCAVKNCNNSNDGKASSISFFVFPSDPLLLKEWVKFCCREKHFNINTAVICMEHFSPEDVANKLEYDMGFAKKRLLNRSAVPTIKKLDNKNEKLFKERQQRIARRENKKTVQRLLHEYKAASAPGEAASNSTSAVEFCAVEFCEDNFPSCSNIASINDEKPKLLQEYESTSTPDEATSNPASDVLMEIEAPVKFFQYNLPSCSKIIRDNDEIAQMKSELKYIREENAKLKTEKGNLQLELKALSKKIEKESKINEYNIKALKTQLAKSHFEVKNLEEKLLTIFTKTE